MIERQLAQFVRDNTQWFPVISITGPRQSGKSTLVRHLFPDYEYFNLEDEQDYNLIAQRPTDFLLEHPHKLIIDEAQRAPRLFNAIQIAADTSSATGQYILSGSQNFLLLKQITQSLAGRVGLVKLLPLSYREAQSASTDITPDTFMLHGGYPRLYVNSIPTHVYYANYVSTYIERDVAEYIYKRSVTNFRTFLSLCALNAGNLLNVSRLATEVGVARATINAWLSILEASYVTFRLPPYSRNSRKQLTKTPKLYFYDTGLLCHLLDINTADQLRDSTYRGAIFENLIIAEQFKKHVNAGKPPRMFFYRDDSRFEVDLIDATNQQNPSMIEIKSGQTYQPSFTKNLDSVGEELSIPREQRAVVTRSETTICVSDVKIWSAHDWLLDT